MTNVFAVGHQPIVREGLKRIMGAVPEITFAGEADNTLEALDLLQKNNSDVLVLDNGKDLLNQVRKQRPDLAVIVLSRDDDARNVSDAIRGGASGYVAMSSSSDEVITAIQKAARGESYVSAALAEKLVFEMGVRKQEAPHQVLSKRELQVSCLIGSGKSLTEIASELGLSPKTVSVHRDHILKKMKMKHNAALIRYVLENRLVE